MLTVKRYTVPVLLSGLGIALSLCWASTGHKRADADAAEASPSGRAPHESAGAPAASDKLTDMLRALTLNVGALVQRVERLEEREDDSPEHAGDPTKPAPISRQALEALGKNDMQEALDRLQIVDDAFSVEARDQHWAAGMETELRSVFQRGNFAGTSVHSVDCKSTFCRMAVKHDSGQSRDNFEYIVREVPGTYYMQHLEPDQRGQSETVAFFVRRGRERENGLFNVIQTL